MNCFEDLEYRGLIKDISSDELKNKLNNEEKCPICILSAVGSVPI